MTQYIGHLYMWICVQWEERGRPHTSPLLHRMTKRRTLGWRAGQYSDLLSNCLSKWDSLDFFLESLSPQPIFHLILYLAIFLLLQIWSHSIPFTENYPVDRHKVLNLFYVRNKKSLSIFLAFICPVYVCMCHIHIHTHTCCSSCVCVFQTYKQNVIDSFGCLLQIRFSCHIINDSTINYQ